MAERKPRATKEEALHAKIEKNEEAKAKLLEKLDALKAVENDLRQQLKDIADSRKKAERAAEARAKREEKKRAEKELVKVIRESGMSVEELKAKLGI